ncbi:MAG: C2H2-type zinc finger protein [Candidatus Bathyarchaeota archaeon]|nr:MAG: C2H2-type zinc finger protein [Candidatus Bathyarchaeota archaeon]
MPCGNCEEKEFKCPKCGMTFETEEKLMKHKKKEHR